MPLTDSESLDALISERQLIGETTGDERKHLSDLRIQAPPTRIGPQPGEPRVPDKAAETLDAELRHPGDDQTTERRSSSNRRQGDHALHRFERDMLPPFASVR